MPTNSNQLSEPVLLTEEEAAIIYLLRATEQGKDNALDNATLRPYYDRFVLTAFTDLSKTLNYIFHAAKLDALRSTTTEIEKVFKK